MQLNSSKFGQDVVIFVFLCSIEDEIVLPSSPGAEVEVSTFQADLIIGKPLPDSLSNRVVHGPAQARKPGQAKPYLSQAKPGQTIWPGGAFGLAQGFLKPKPSRKALARRDSTLADKGGNRLEDVKENMYCLL